VIIIEVRMVSARGRKYDRMLGKGVIENDGTGTVTTGNYKGMFKRIPGGKEYVGGLTGFKRKKYGVWHLIMAVLATTGLLDELNPTKAEDGR